MTTYTKMNPDLRLIIDTLVLITNNAPADRAAGITAFMEKLKFRRETSGDIESLLESVAWSMYSLATYYRLNGATGSDEAVAADAAGSMAFHMAKTMEG